MNKTKKITIAKRIALTAIAGIALGGMYAAYQSPNGQVNFTDNAIAKTVTSTYKATETAAVRGWEATENFFVSHFFQKEGETTAQAKARLQQNNNK